MLGVYDLFITITRVYSASVKKEMENDKQRNPHTLFLWEVINVFQQEMTQRIFCLAFSISFFTDALYL